MPPVPQPFAFAGTLQLAADQSLPPDPIPFNGSGSFVALAQEKLNLTGSGTQAVAFGSVGSPGAKGVAIRYDAQAGAAPLLITVNAGSQPLEVSPGGFIQWFNPAPAAGAISLSIAYTASCQVQVWVLG
jgi:hypothetical protein